MKNLSRIYQIAYIVLFAGTANAAENREQILVSVNRIISAEQSHTKQVQITFTVHEPATVKSSQFVTTTESKDRSEIRSEYPISGLFSIMVPLDFFNKLKAQRERTNHSEEIVDSGIDPRRISDSIMLPEINFTILEETRKPHVTRSNNTP